MCQVNIIKRYALEFKNFRNAPLAPLHPQVSSVFGHLIIFHETKKGWWVNDGILIMAAYEIDIPGQFNSSPLKSDLTKF